MKNLEKNLKKLLTMIAVALIGAFCFVGCSSDDEEDEYGRGRQPMYSFSELDQIRNMSLTKAYDKLVKDGFVADLRETSVEGMKAVSNAVHDVNIYEGEYDNAIYYSCRVLGGSYDENIINKIFEQEDKFAGEADSIGIYDNSAEEWKVLSRKSKAIDIFMKNMDKTGHSSITFMYDDFITRVGCDSPEGVNFSYYHFYIEPKGMLLKKK